MDIKVNLPKPENTTGKDIKSFLRQMELSVHHLQKAVEQLETDGLLTEATYIIYRYPVLESIQNEGKVITEDDLDEGGQEIRVEINTI